MSDMLRRLLTFRLLGRVTMATAIGLLVSCSTSSGPVADSITTPDPVPEEPPPPPPPPPPPKPSLSRLQDRGRPHLDFFGATIYADSIDPNQLIATGNVYLDGTSLHVKNRAFPLAVYANEVRLDLQNRSVTLTGWPIVKTDSAFVQAQAEDTVIELSEQRMSQIVGPARYVIGDKGSELFLP